MLIAFDDVIAYIESKKKKSSIVIELDLRGRKLNNWLVFISQFYFKVPKTIRLNETHYFFLYLGFLSRTFMIHRTAGGGGGYLLNSSLPLPPASQTLRHYSGDYCRELTSEYS